MTVCPGIDGIDGKEATDHADSGKEATEDVILRVASGRCWQECHLDVQVTSEDGRVEAASR